MRDFRATRTIGMVSLATVGFVSDASVAYAESRPLDGYYLLISNSSLAADSFGGGIFEIGPLWFMVTNNGIVVEDDYEEPRLGHPFGVMPRVSFMARNNTLLIEGSSAFPLEFRLTYDSVTRMTAYAKGAFRIEFAFDAWIDYDMGPADPAVWDRARRAPYEGMVWALRDIVAGNRSCWVSLMGRTRSPDPARSDDEDLPVLPDRLATVTHAFRLPVEGADRCEGVTTDAVLHVGFRLSDETPAKPLPLDEAGEVYAVVALALGDEPAMLFNPLDQGDLETFR